VQRSGWWHEATSSGSISVILDYNSVHHLSYFLNNNYYYYYYYHHFMATWTLSGTTWVSWYQKGKTRKVKPICIYWSKRYWVAVASAGQYANLHLTSDRKPCQNSTTQVFTGQMPFMPPDQQHQSTEGKFLTLITWNHMPKVKTTCQWSFKIVGNF